MTPTRKFAAVGLALLATVSPWARSQDTPPAPAPPAAPAAPAPPPADPSVTAAALRRDAPRRAPGRRLATRPRPARGPAEAPEALRPSRGVREATNRLPEAEDHPKTFVEASPIFPLARFQYGYVLSCGRRS